MKHCIAALIAMCALACDDGASTPEDVELDGSGIDMAVELGVDSGSIDAGSVDTGIMLDAAVDMQMPDAAVSGPPAAYTAQCAGCHGADGAGTASGFELLHPIVEYATWVVRNGRPAGDTDFQTVMGGYDEAALSDADLDAILVWLNDAPRPETGEALYRDLCANCHGPDGRGGVVREGARHSPASIQRHVRGGEGGSAYASRQRYMPEFGPSVLTANELELIIEYLTE